MVPGGAGGALIASAADPRVSILIRACNGGARLERAVAAALAQDGVPLEVVLLDSGSRDGVPGRLAGGRVRLAPLEVPFTHPGSSNAAARLARGGVLVFLSQDAVPAGHQWLSRLLEPLERPDVAASFSRQVPAPGTPILECRELERAYPPSGDASVVLSNAASALRRELWLSHPFDERLPLAEDLEWGLWALRHGFRLAYAADSVVEHSHGYAGAAMRERFLAEGRALAMLGRPPFRTESATGAWLRGLPGDLLCVLAAGRILELPAALTHHLTQYRALAEGARGSAPLPATGEDAGTAPGAHA